MFFSFLCRVHSPFETSSSVVVPSWEPQAMKHPLSCTRRQKRASSHTCWRVRQTRVGEESGAMSPFVGLIIWLLGRLSQAAPFRHPW